MELVYKCDFCTETNKKSEEILKHEEECVFNHSKKYCYSCDFHHHDFYGSPYCEIEKDYRNGEKIGGCKDWYRE